MVFYISRAFAITHAAQDHDTIIIKLCKQKNYKATTEKFIQHRAALKRGKASNHELVSARIKEPSDSQDYYLQ